MDIIEKPVFDYGTDAELRLREHFQDARSHNVCERVTLGFELLVLRHTGILRVFPEEVERAFLLQEKT